MQNQRMVPIWRLAFALVLATQASAWAQDEFGSDSSSGGESMQDSDAPVVATQGSNDITYRSDAEKRAAAEQANGDPNDPDEFKPKRTANAPLPTGVERNGHRRVVDSDRNIDYEPMLKRLEYQEKPKAYRQPYLGSEGWRPNTFSLSVGGRTPGYGGFFDYSFNRVGIGFSLAFRPVQRFYVSEEDAAVQGIGQYFGNVWVHYNLIPYHVSPYILVGVEYANGAESAIEAIAGAGIEARVWDGFTIFVEVIRHETVRKTFAGLAVGYAF